MYMQRQVIYIYIYIWGMDEFSPRTKAQMLGGSHGVEWARPIYLRSKENLYGSFP